MAAELISIMWVFFTHYDKIISHSHQYKIESNGYFDVVEVIVFLNHYRVISFSLKEPSPCITMFTLVVGRMLTQVC